MKYLKIYKETIRNSIAEVAAYRVDFLLSSLVTIISNVVFPLVTILIYSSGASFEGWSMYEVLLVQSIFTMANGIASMVFYGVVGETMHRVADGTLELLLVKPVNCLFFLIATRFNIVSFGVVLGGAALFGMSAYSLNCITPVGIAISLVLFIFGLCVMFGFRVLMAATSFIWVANSRIPEMYDSVSRLGNYPQTIYPKWIVGLTSFVVPVATVGFFPACALLGRLESWMLFSIIPCIIFMVVSVLIYHYMVRLYEGVGG
ncbi:MAG: ABC-2 family transporter protein [Lachnospiraceae bacterium]|nr:ABC-2 family transporter protein [Lachnospiraceae bacterium]